MPTTVKLGLIQTACSADPDGESEENPRRSSNAPRSRARRSSARRNCFARNIFARAKTTKISSSPNQFPARAPRPFRSSRRNTRVVIIASLFEKRAAGVYHNTAAIIDADGSLLGIYRKMHIPG